jgi:hypothetical protein
MSRIHEAFIQDTTRFRRRLTGVVAIAAPVVYALSVVFGVDHTTDNNRQLDIVRVHPGQFTAMVIFEYVTYIFVAMVLVGLVGLVRRRGAVLAHVAAALGIVGAAGYLMGWGPMVLPLSRMADRPAALEALDHMGVLFQLGAALSGFVLLGLILGFVAAWRASIVPGWAVIVAVIALVFLNVSGTERAVNLAGAVVLAVPMARLGLAVLRGERGDATKLGTSGVPTWQDATA